MYPPVGKHKNSSGHSQYSVGGYDLPIKGGPSGVRDVQLLEQRPPIVPRAKAYKGSDIQPKYQDSVPVIVIYRLEIRHLCPAGRTEPSPEIQNYGLVLGEKGREGQIFTTYNFLALINGDLEVGWEAPSSRAIPRPGSLGAARHNEGDQ